MLGNEASPIHGDRLVRYPFPKPVRDQLVSSRTRPNPITVCPQRLGSAFFLRSETDVITAIELMRTSFDLATRKGVRRAGWGDLVIVIVFVGLSSPFCPFHLFSTCAALGRRSYGGDGAAFPPQSRRQPCPRQPAISRIEPCAR